MAVAQRADMFQELLIHRIPGPAPVK